MLPTPVFSIFHNLSPTRITDTIYRFSFPRQYTYIDDICLCSTPLILDTDGYHFMFKVLEPISVRLVQDEIILCEINANIHQVYTTTGFQTQYSVPIDLFNGYPLITESIRTNLSLEVEFNEIPTQNFWLQIRLSNVDVNWKFAFTNNTITMPLWSGDVCHYINGAITI